MPHSFLLVFPQVQIQSLPGSSSFLSSCCCCYCCCYCCYCCCCYCSEMVKKITIYQILVQFTFTFQVLTPFWCSNIIYRQSLIFFIHFAKQHYPLKYYKYVIFRRYIPSFNLNNTFKILFRLI